MTGGCPCHQGDIPIEIGDLSMMNGDIPSEIWDRDIPLY